MKKTFQTNQCYFQLSPGGGGVGGGGGFPPESQIPTPEKHPKYKKKHLKFKKCIEFTPPDMFSPPRTHGELTLRTHRINTETNMHAGP